MIFKIVYGVNGVNKVVLGYLLIMAYVYRRNMEILKIFTEKKVFLLFLSVFFLFCVPSFVAGGEVVMIRGNYWVSGIAGFGSNGFSALVGEYRLQAAGAISQVRLLANERARFLPGEGDFTVYATREPLFFSGEWQARPGIGGGSPVLQRMGEEGFLAAAAVNDGSGASWTAIFRFKQGLEGAGISGDEFNRMLRNWTSRLFYFLSHTRTSRDISLPAVLVF